MNDKPIRHLLNLVVALGLMLSATACNSQVNKSPNDMENSDPNSSLRATDLLAHHFSDLFMYADDSLLQALWNDGKHEADLRGIAHDATAKPRARFLAAEILRSQGKTVLTSDGIAPVAEAYAAALRGTSEESEGEFWLNGNVWGMMGEQDQIGDLSQELIQFGDEAVPILLPLLDDPGLIPFEGSEEATIGNARAYQVRDYSAFILSRIRGISFQLPDTRADRDKAIARLRSDLAGD